MDNSRDVYLCQLCIINKAVVLVCDISHTQSVVAGMGQVRGQCT